MPNDIELQLSKFFGGLNARLESVRKVRESYNEQMAFDFCATNDFFRPNENTTSRVLAFFLNPQGNHGQKRAFLEIFINYLEEKIKAMPACDDEHHGSENPEVSSPSNVSTSPTDSMLSRNHPKEKPNTIDKKAKQKLLYNLENSRHLMVSVSTEEPTEQLVRLDGSRKRIDIVIAFGERGKDFIIGIENKIGAADQPNQISDYSKELEIRAGERKYLLLYLTPNGHAPSTDSIKEVDREPLENKGGLINISYRDDIISLFGKFEQSCKADNVRAFLRDFGKHLKKCHKGVSDMAEKDVIKNLMKANPEILNYAEVIKSCANEIWSESVICFIKSIRTCLANDFICGEFWEDDYAFGIDILKNKDKSLICDEIPISVLYDKKDENFFCALSFHNQNGQMLDLTKYLEKIKSQLDLPHTDKGAYWPAGWIDFDRDVDRFSDAWVSSALKENSIEKQAKVLAEKIKIRIEDIGRVWNS